MTDKIKMHGFDVDTGAQVEVELHVTGNSANVFASAKSGGAITPSDAGAIEYKALFVGGGGNLKVDLIGGDTITLTAIEPGYHMLHVSRVYATGTTATNIVGLNW